MDIEALKAHTRKYWESAKDTHVAEPAYYQLARSELEGILGRHMPPGGNVLDVGCGNGEYTALIARQAGQVLAFDISESLLEAARHRCAQMGNVSFLKADLSYGKVAFAGHVDAVFCMGVFVCLPDQAQLLRLLADFHDYLVEGGLLVLRESTTRGEDRYVRYSSGHLGYYRNKSALLSVLLEHGFELCEEVPLKAVQEPFNDYLVLRKRGARQAGASSA